MDFMNGYQKEYRKGAYFFENRKNPLDDYQNTASFKNGISDEQLGKVSDKKVHFV